MAGIRINSNIASLNAQRRLSESGALLSKSFERLSSGQRITRASDDAAGLAIAEALKISARVCRQGVRNVNDSVSFFSIAQEGVQQLKNIIIRGKELAAQAANGTYSDLQRKALDSELQTLGEEYNRILGSTSFNGRNVFSRSEDSLVTEAGGSALETALSAERASDVDTIRRISTAADGSEGNLDSETSGKVAISGDGRYVVFSSNASNLVTGDGNGTVDVYIKDRQTGTIQRLSTSGSGVEGNSSSAAPSISADGRYVVFGSSASNLVAGDNNVVPDVFVKDPQTGAIQRVSTGSSGIEANGASWGAAASADGRYVVFTSGATNLVAGDGNSDWDIFVKDLQTQTLLRVSTDSSGQEGNGTSENASVSADGRYVAFRSDSTNLVAGDGNSYSDIFVKDLQTGNIQRVSTDNAGGEGNGSSTYASISADGRYVVFQSDASNLVAGDTNNKSDIFVKDLRTGDIKRISTDSSGLQGNGHSSIASISADGRYVAFQSAASNLVAGDTNGLWEVFLKDLDTGRTQRLSVSQSGREGFDAWDAQGAQRVSLSADGRYAAFYSDMRDLLDGPSAGYFYHVYATANSFADSYQLTRFQWVDIKTRSEALNAQPWLETYLNELSSYEGGLGTAMSRLETAKNNLFSTTENVEAAESRIRDADIAQESAALVRTQILQQVGSAVLAQANQAPALAIALLRTS